MLTGEIRSQIDSIWNAFWSGGISNPLEVMEQITYLLFLRRLDDLHTLEENKALRLKKPMERRIFPEGTDSRGRNFKDLRWSRFKNFAPSDMFLVVNEHVSHRWLHDVERSCGRSSILTSIPAFFTIDQAATSEMGKMRSWLSIFLAFV